MTVEILDIQCDSHVGVGKLITSAAWLSYHPLWDVAGHLITHFVPEPLNFRSMKNCTTTSSKIFTSCLAVGYLETPQFTSC